MKRFLLLLLTSLLCMQCSLFKKDDPKPKPTGCHPRRQEHPGCYVNGYPWVPAGRPSMFVPNLEVDYSPRFAGGSFDLRAQRVEGDQKGFINIVMFGLYPKWALIHWVSTKVKIRKFLCMLRAMGVGTKVETNK